MFDKTLDLCYGRNKGAYQSIKRPPRGSADTGSAMRSALCVEKVMNSRANWNGTMLWVVVAEWLRRWTRNPLGAPCAGSNPADNDWHTSMLLTHQWHTALYQIADVRSGTLLYYFIGTGSHPSPPMHLLAFILFTALSWLPALLSEI